MDANFDPVTFRAKGRLNRIITPAGISHPYDPRKSEPSSVEKNIHWGDALWDTGATQSVILDKIARQIGLIPTGKRDVRTGSGPEVWNTYLVNVHLENQGMVYNIPVLGCTDDDADFDAIIGMDIITLGDFAITNPGGNTTFSFRVPAKEAIDFEQQKRDLLLPVTAGPVQGRNARCNCGSGKKHKHCCGKK